MFVYFLNQVLLGVKTKNITVPTHFAPKLNQSNLDFDILQWFFTYKFTEILIIKLLGLYSLMRVKYAINAASN